MKLKIVICQTDISAAADIGYEFESSEFEIRIFKGWFFCPVSRVTYLGSDLLKNSQWRDRMAAHKRPNKHSRKRCVSHSHACIRHCQLTVDSLLFFCPAYYCFLFIFFLSHCSRTETERVRRSVFGVFLYITVGYCVN